MTRGIRVKNTDDIQKINKIVTKYGFDIWIHGKSGMVDAKSLLGMFLLSLNEPLQIVLEDSVDPRISPTTLRSTTRTLTKRNDSAQKAAALAAAFSIAIAHTPDMRLPEDSPAFCPGVRIPDALHPRTDAAPVRGTRG